MVEEQPKWRTGKICCIEIPAVDVARSARFYQQAFGWKMRQRGDGSTSFDDTVGEVSGTFVLGRQPATDPGFGIYILVADAGAALAAVQAAGGEVVRPVDPAAGEVFAWFKDPGGSTLGVYQQPGLARTEAAAARQTQASAPQASAPQATTLPRTTLPRTTLPRTTPPTSAGCWTWPLLGASMWPRPCASPNTSPRAAPASPNSPRRPAATATPCMPSSVTWSPRGCSPRNRPAGSAATGPREQLRESSFLDLDGIGGRMAHTWGTLLDYVRTGQPAYQQVFGRPFWEDLAAHPQIAAEFDALMGPAGHGIPDFDIELSDGWGHIRTVVDVGGGTGAMLASLLRRHPQATGALVDLPGTVARARSRSSTASESPAGWTAKGQSFFDPLPAGADLYVLKSVLNDWADEPTVAILRRCAEAARPDGIVAILGGVSADQTPRSLGIDMLVAGGKTSALTQFTELARRAGLEVVAARTQPSGRFVVECRPAGP